MKYIEIEHQERSLNAKTDNSLIEINFTDIHMEFVLENGSMLVMSDEAYYEIIGDATYYKSIDNDFDIDKLILENENIKDNITNFSYNRINVKSIEKIKYNSHNIYVLNKR